MGALHHAFWRTRESIKVTSNALHHHEYLFKGKNRKMNLDAKFHAVKFILHLKNKFELLDEDDEDDVKFLVAAIRYIT